MTAALQGVKVLVVEDEYLVAALMEDILASAGCVVTGPIPRLAQALDAASSEACDVAVLDINLAGARVYPVAEILAQRNVPFVFVTGYGPNALPPKYAKQPRICKPFRMAELLATISDIVKTAPPSHQA